MASRELVNTDFLNFYDDACALREALKPVTSVAKPALRGVKRQVPVPQATADMPALEEALRESLAKVLSNPLTKTQPKGHGIIPLRAVHDCRKLHAMLVKIRRQGDENAAAKVSDDEIPPDFDAQFRRFIAAIDPTHPFLEKKVDDGAEDPEAAGRHHQARSQAEEDGRSKHRTQASSQSAYCQREEAIEVGGLEDGEATELDAVQHGSAGVGDKTFVVDDN
jgi:hypothetical protein